ncbi:hypothetical protein HPA02_27150 [Bisbaumannia pacifica]|uniref:Tail fiber protein n=1 Tax=Bisbaumannia pacifica TaxID=77098 RepID=A0A510XAH5_9GAMM|nr:hypothetical protein [Halomonas pacifica]GEK48432.1 hypothetical protein HPA02_27150 [Halomonas pacifica]
MADRYYSNADEGQRFQPGTTVEAGAVDQKFDEVTAGFQQVAIDTDRSLKLPAGEGPQELDATALQRRNRAVGFDAEGNLVLMAGFGWRGDWATATDYALNEVFRDPASKNLYVVLKAHTSATIASDLTAGNIELAISVAEIEAAKVAAIEAAGNAAASEEGAAESEASARAAASFKGLWSSLTGALAKPASVKHSGEYWELLNDLPDVAASEPGVSGDWTSKTVLTGSATGPIDMAGHPLTAAAFSAGRYDLASAVGTDTLDLAQQQVFRIDASVNRTLAFANAPGANRAMVIVVRLVGSAGAVTWPAGIAWSEGTAPELRTSWTAVTLLWDGIDWRGFVSGGEDL